MYVDDAITFIRSAWQAIHPCVTIVVDFREETGLRMNFEKCLMHLIRCSPEHKELVAVRIRVLDSAGTLHVSCPL